MYYKKLKRLFNGRSLSVKSFYQITATLPETERDEAIRLVYQVAQAEWKTCNAAYRQFLIRFLENDLQRFLDFLRRESAWGELLIPLEDPEWTMLLLFALLEQKEERKAGRRLLAFSLLLFTGSRWKISTLLQYRKTRRITPADLLDLLGWVKMGG